MNRPEHAVHRLAVLSSLSDHQLALWLAQETSEACMVAILTLIAKKGQCNSLILESVAKIIVDRTISEEVQKLIVSLLTKSDEMEQVLRIMTKLDIRFLLPCPQFKVWSSPDIVLLGLETLVVPALGHKRSAVRLEGLKVADVLLRQYPFKTTYPILCRLMGRRVDADSIPIDEFFEPTCSVNYLACLQFDSQIAVRHALFKYLTEWAFELTDHEDIDWCLAPFLMNGLVQPDTLGDSRITSQWVTKTARRYLPCLLSNSVADFGTCTESNRINLLEVTLKYLKENMAEYLPLLLREQRPTVLALIGQYCSPNQWWPLVKKEADSLYYLILNTCTETSLDFFFPEIAEFADPRLIKLLDQRPHPYCIEIECRRVELGITTDVLDPCVTAAVLERFTVNLNVNLLSNLFRSNTTSRKDISLCLVVHFHQLNQAEQEQILQQVIVYLEEYRVSTLMQLVLRNEKLILPLLAREPPCDLLKHNIDTLISNLEMPDILGWLVLCTKQVHHSPVLLDLLGNRKSISSDEINAAFEWVCSTNEISADIISSLVPLAIQEPRHMNQMAKIVQMSHNECLLELIHRWECEGYLARSVTLKRLL